MNLGEEGHHDIHLPVLWSKDSAGRYVRRMPAQERLVAADPRGAALALRGLIYGVSFYQDEHLGARTPP